MEDLRQYVISVVCAAIFCGILLSLLQKSSARDILKLLCGLFLAFTVIRPISQIGELDLSDFGLSYSEDAAQAAALGEKYTREAMAEIIIEETEAYILDKAEALNVSLEADVTVSLDDIPVPAAVRLTGEVSPYAKGELQRIIENELGIAKEDQLWTG